MSMAFLLPSIVLISFFNVGQSSGSSFSSLSASALYLSCWLVLVAVDKLYITCTYCISALVFICVPVNGMFFLYFTSIISFYFLQTWYGNAYIMWFPLQILSHSPSWWLGPFCPHHLHVGHSIHLAKRRLYLIHFFNGITYFYFFWYLEWGLKIAIYVGFN